MNMSNVKAMSTEVVVNNVRYRKGVKQIKDSNNNVLWSFTPGWTTIWEGNKTFIAYGNSSYSDEYICRSIFESNVSSTQYRCTFSFNYNKPAGADLLYVNTNDTDLWSKTPTPSPFTITIPANYIYTTKLLGLSIDGSDMPVVQIVIDQTGAGFNDGVNGIWFVGYGGGSAGQAIYWTSITLTKIEQYIRDFPYRRLEYIHFNGAESIDTGIANASTNNYQSNFTTDEVIIDATARSYANIYNSALADAISRSYLCTQTYTGLKACVGSTLSSDSSETPVDTKLWFSCTYNKDSSNKPRFYYYLKNKVTNVTILSAAPIVATAAGDLPTSNIHLGCKYLTATNTTDQYWKGKSYDFQVRQGGGSGTLLNNLIPCQRKSDNVCGMYDTINSVFLPMTGTTITNAAAGPVVDEDWDLQA